MGFSVESVLLTGSPIACWKCPEQGAEGSPPTENEAHGLSGRGRNDMALVAQETFRDSRSLRLRAPPWASGILQLGSLWLVVHCEQVQAIFFQEQFFFHVLINFLFNFKITKHWNITSG